MSDEMPCIFIGGCQSPERCREAQYCLPSSGDVHTDEPERVEREPRAAFADSVGMRLHEKV